MEHLVIATYFRPTPAWNHDFKGIMLFFYFDNLSFNGCLFRFSIVVVELGKARYWQFRGEGTLGSKLTVVDGAALHVQTSAHFQYQLDLRRKGTNKYLCPVSCSKLNFCTTGLQYTCKQFTIFQAGKAFVLKTVFSALWVIIPIMVFCF